MNEDLYWKKPLIYRVRETKKFSIDSFGMFNEDENIWIFIHQHCSRIIKIKDFCSQIKKRHFIESK